MANMLYSALSIISNLGKEDDDLVIDKSHELAKENSYLIEGTFENINNINGLLTKENNTSYFYSFSLSNDYKVIKNNKKIDFSEIKTGDNIVVTYSGDVALVYPPRLEKVTKIEIINKNK